jgi:hypothetical protein
MFLNDVNSLSEADLETDHECLASKQEISTDLSRINLSLKCDLLSGIESKSESQCLKEESKAYKMFQDDPVFQRIKLHPDDYFKEFKTVAFEKVFESFLLTGYP